MSIFEKYGDWHVELVAPMDNRHTEMMHSSPTLNELKEQLYQEFKERLIKEINVDVFGTSNYGKLIDKNENDKLNDPTT